MSYSENQYLKLLKDVYTYGQDTGDRTGTGMRSLFGEKMEFDLREGFPLLTTKKMFTRGVFGELLFFLSGSTSNKDLNDKYKINFWNEWSDEKNELPNIYSKQWIRWEQDKKIVKLNKKYIDVPKESYDYKINELVEPPPKLNKYCLSGNIYKSRYGEYRVISNRKRITVDNSERSFYDIQFLKTGYIKNNVRHDQIANNRAYDPYFPSVVRVGFIGEGDFSKIPSRLYNDLYNTWSHMLHRCYSVKDRGYNNYGGKGIFVSNRWFSFTNFIEDIQKIPNWYKKKENFIGYQLDKDYYGSNCYSKATCVWSSNKDNAIYKDRVRPIIETVTNKIFLTQVEASLYFGKHLTVVQKSLRKNRETKDGYKFEYLEYDKEKYVYRYALPFNQIQYIIDEIKNNPNSRRILFTGWNAPEMQWEDTALPCCHSTVVQFYVEDGYLNLYHHQRSGDMFLGVPVNIASYATLLMMVAQQTGLKAGKMIHSIGVAHIYHNHFKQVEEQLSRNSFDLPQLNIKCKHDSIFDYQLDDFEVVDYKYHPLIKGEVAI